MDETTPATNVLGYTQVVGGQSGGSWFHLVKTNGVISQISAESAPVPAYLDDLVLARRSLSWSRTNFTESVTNNGAVDNSIPLTITLAADSFLGAVGDDFVAAGKMTVSGLPSNLVAVARLTNATQVMVTLTNRALLHEAVNSTNLTIQFANNAFTLGSAWDVLGVLTNVALVFSNTPSLGYSINLFNESAANDGTIDNSHPCLITLTNGAFAGTQGDDLIALGALAVSGLPANLVAVARLTNSTQVLLTLTGVAISNNVVDNLNNVTLTFHDVAFNTVPASSVFHSSTNISIHFVDSSYLNYQTYVFNETVTNNGTLNGTTVSLVNKTFIATNGEDMALSGGRVSAPNLPASLVLHVVCDASGTNAALFFTGAAGSHAAINSLTNLEIKFTDNAFVGGNATGVANADLTNLRIRFTDPRTLTYSRTTFTEISGGIIDNRNPMTITLSGDTFAGNIGDDLSSLVTVGGAMPSGLNARFTRDSATQLSVQLVGVATANAAPANNVSDISFTFLNGVFANGNAVYVGDYQQLGISVSFTNDTGFFNVTPCQESFEEYPPALWLVGTNGWSGDSANACIVTNNALVTSNLMAYVTPMTQLPISTNHTQVLYIQDTVKNEIHSESFTNVYVDFMLTPSPVWEAPMTDPSYQSGFYVTTNGHLMIWQKSFGAAAEWIMLSNAPAISTSQWSRFTVQNDYAHNMFQIQVNQGQPISDSRGWTAGGASATGSWFHMVQTNGVMTEIEFNGAGKGFLDDFTVLSSMPATLSKGVVGSVFLYR